jgi:hypothetical protein
MCSSSVSTSARSPTSGGSASHVGDDRRIDVPRRQIVDVVDRGREVEGAHRKRERYQGAAGGRPPTALTSAPPLETRRIRPAPRRCGRGVAVPRTPRPRRGGV